MTDTLPPIPLEIKDIDKNWLTAALRTHAPDVELHDFEMVDFMRSTCTKIRLKLDVTNNGSNDPIPPTVILKGGFEPHSRHLHCMHEREVRAYAELLPQIGGLRYPQIYFTQYDPEHKQGVLIMEDLVARGVNFCSALEPQGYEAIARRLGDLARFHAGSWGSPEFRPGGKWDWVDDTTANQLNYFDEYLQPDVWKHYIRSSRGAAASVRFHDLAWMRDALQRYAALAATLPHCVLHGDTHLGNLYVDVDGTPGFFDSIGGRAPAILEVAYHLCCALDVADRPQLEGPLIRHYLTELAKAGVEAPSFEDAMRQYAFFLAYGYCVFIINEAVFQVEAVNTAYTARFSAAMLDHDTMGRLKEIPL